MDPIPLRMLLRMLLRWSTALFRVMSLVVQL
jgi:hypothetical protein